MGPVASGPIQQNPEGGDGVARSTNINIKKGLLISLTGIGGLISALTLFASTASADSGVVLSSYNWSYSSVNFTVESKAVSNGGVKGKIQVKYRLKNGLPKKQQVGCRWFTGGVNSYTGRRGETVKVDWTGKRAYACPSKSSPSGWLKAGGPPNWENCGNIYWPPFMRKPKGKIYKPFQVQVVKEFTVVAKVTVKATQTARVTADARCSTSSSAAAATAMGSGYGFASATATARARTSAQATALAAGSARQNIELNQSESIKVSAEASAKVQLSLNASAVVSCSSTTPGTTTVTTPGTTTTTTTTTPQPPAVRRCTISALAKKDDPYTAYVTVDTEGTGTPNSTFNWGDGTSAGGTTSGIHTYPKPAPGPAGTGVTYRITVSAKFADGQVRDCGSRDFFVPAPPPSGNPGPPPLP